MWVKIPIIHAIFACISLIPVFPIQIHHALHSYSGLPDPNPPCFAYFSHPPLHFFIGCIQQFAEIRRCFHFAAHIDGVCVPWLGLKLFVMSVSWLVSQKHRCLGSSSGDNSCLAFSSWDLLWTCIFLGMCLDSCFGRDSMGDQGFWGYWISKVCKESAVGWVGLGILKKKIRRLGEKKITCMKNW